MLALALTILTASELGATALAAEASSQRPNVVVVMTDDQTASSMRVMDDTRRLLGSRGTEFRHSFAAYPLCCPSRATYLTGQYAHNHGVLDNDPPTGGYQRLRDRRTVPVWLRRAGYHTGFVGKYLNGYGGPRPREIPPGWDEWYALTSGTTYRMFGYDLNKNGRIVEYGRDRSEYQTDVLSRLSQRFVRRRSQRRQPFYLSIMPVAPHRDGSRSRFPNPIPAPRHRGRFEGAPLPRPPSFNEKDVSDKPRRVRGRRSLTRGMISAIRNGYRSELASLLAVDDLVEDLLKTLRRKGELDSTVVLYTSDNGYMHGEHRLDFIKSWLYEESVRVPLLARGPGFPVGRVRDQLVANVDLAPTLVDLARARARLRMDGRSLLPLARDPSAGTGRSILFEAQDPPRPAYSAVRTHRYVYAEYDYGRKELYDLRNDPFQLDSLHRSRAYRAIRRQLSERLDDLRNCAGSSCRQPE